MSIEDRNHFSDNISKHNKDKISCYNMYENRFSRFDINDIPFGWIDARGKTKWDHDKTGKRFKVFVENI